MAEGACCIVRRDGNPAVRTGDGRGAAAGGGGGVVGSARGAGGSVAGGDCAERTAAFGAQSGRALGRVSGAGLVRSGVLAPPVCLVGADPGDWLRRGRAGPRRELVVGGAGARPAARAP